MNKAAVSAGLQNLGDAERAALEQYALASAGLDPQRLQLAQGVLQQQQVLPLQLCLALPVPAS